MQRRWTLPVLAGLWIAGCGFFEFAAPERARDTGEGGSSGAGSGTGGGGSGVSGTSSATGGTAGDETSGGSGGDSEGGVSGTTSGAAGAGEGGTAGTNQGGMSGTMTGGVGGDGTTGGTGGQGPTSPVPQGLKLWLDAASLAGQGPISMWPNRVTGAEPNATQPAPELRPVLGLVDSRPGVTFDGTRWMVFAEGFQNFSVGLTFFLVARFDAPGACTEIFQVSNGLEIDDISVQSDVLVAEPGVLLFEVGNANVGTGPSTIGGLDVTLATIVMRPPETASIFIDTIPGASATDPVFVPRTATRNQNFLGSGLYSNCDPFEGVLFELLLYNRALSTPDIALVNGYLREKWNCCDG